MQSKKVRRTKNEPVKRALPPYLQEYNIHHPTDPRVKARMLVAGIQAAVILCLQQQRHLFGFQTPEREQALYDLSQSFTNGQWAPNGLTTRDVRAIDPALIEGVVFAVGQGRPLAGIEGAIHEQYKGAAASVPPVQNPWRGRPEAGRRGYTNHSVS